MFVSGTWRVASLLKNRASYPEPNSALFISLWPLVAISGISLLINYAQVCDERAVHGPDVDSSRRPTSVILYRAPDLISGLAGAFT